MSVLFKDKITGLWKRAAANLIYASFPVGSIVAYGGSSDVAAPTGCMYCHGQAISRSDYGDLFDVIGTKFGVGDGSTTFNLPDMRESVPVGAGSNSSNTIAAHDVYTVGEFKDDQFQDHQHKPARDVYNSAGLGPTSRWVYNSVQNVKYGTENSGVSVNGRTGTTTHGKRTGVEYIIKVAK